MLKTSSSCTRPCLNKSTNTAQKQNKATLSIIFPILCQISIDVAKGILQNIRLCHDESTQQSSVGATITESSPHSTVKNC